MNCARTRIQLKARRRIRRRSHWTYDTLSRKVSFNLAHHAAAGYRLDILWSYSESVSYSTSKISFPVLVSRVLVQRAGSPARTLSLQQLKSEGQTRRPPKVRTSLSPRGMRRKWPGSHLMRSALYTFESRKIEYSS